MLKPKRADEIREAARSMQVALWQERATVWAEPPALPRLMIPMRVEDVIVTFLGLSLEQPEVIPPEPGETLPDGIFTAGLIDRANRKIAIARRLPIEQRVFTAAHEIGHYVLHEDSVVYHRSRVMHRDRPLSSPDLSRGREPVEQEADLFAAEFLMPTKLLWREFELRFGEPIRRQDADDALAFYLSQPGRQVSAYDVHTQSVRKLAFLIAKLDTYGGRTFDSLATRFRVSASAMSIQLIDRGLVR